MKKDAGVTTGAWELLPGDFAGGFPIGELLKVPPDKTLVLVDSMK